MRLSFLLSTFSVLVLAVTGWAQDYASGPGLGIAIPNDGYDGTLGSMAGNTIVVAPDGTDWVVGVTVEVAVDHIWVGDLVFKLESPAGTVVTLAHRPGLDGVLDDGDGCCGDSSSLGNVFPILFSDTASSGVKAEDMGVGVPADEVIGDPANGSSDNYIPDADDLSVDVGGPLLDSLGALAGEQAAGNWTLYIGDAGGMFAGVLDGWTLHLLTEADDDGDGVLNDSDSCADTPTCATNVDANGCAIDSDGDGNVDGCDPPAETCCGGAGPVAPLGLAIGLLLLSRLGGCRSMGRSK